ncbi:(2Fe-2S)-binding protein [Shouchella lonarensis]|uniref:Sarcosine oxidase subunit alpha n=1 Tax=Shouchella lonarensis TaxID=1464122 RepID=A0A1G6JTD7_9BACI|nr:(2Fe-2S)-binding protein [Shouchella lonarensis]SDC21918.1 sarcosine oxidase subunit alpha [Shouchella lonarensis]
MNHPLRIKQHPILNIPATPQTFSFQFDDTTYEAIEGDTIASALLARGVRILRRHEETGETRGIYCNIGHCFECRVTVDGKESERACLTPVQAGMTVYSGTVLPTPFQERSSDKWT